MDGMAQVRRPVMTLRPCWMKPLRGTVTTTITCKRV
jgi:hypothetical protein